jgi:hypothetical protein
VRLFFLLLLLPATLHAAVQTYPAPGGLAPSPHYAVTVSQDGRTHDSFVYISKAQWRSNRSKDTSWTTFSFSGKVTVTVRKLSGGFKSCRILPSKYGITPTVDGRAASFTLDRPRKVSVEFDDPIPHPMLVFADPPETDVPKPDDSSVLCFGPGVHDIGKEFRIPAGKGVYLAGGAYVKGTLVAQDPKNLRIWGRGVLSGEQFGAKTVHLLHVRGWNTHNTRVEGITLANSPHFNLVLDGRRHVVRNVKMISWWFSTDGVGCGPDGLVEDCFFKVNDDAVKLYHSGMRVRRCVIWQCENGAPFQISWNMPSDNSGFHVSDCIVLRCEHRWKNDNNAIFDAIHGGTGHMRDYLFENIHIENAPWRLVNLLMKKTEFSARQRGFGSISDVTFRNITVDGPQRLPNTIAGASAQHRISNVTFENVRVNGRLIRSAADGDFDIGPETTSNVRFVVTDRQ